MKPPSPQEAVDKIWTDLNTTTPGIVSTILPVDGFARKVREQHSRTEVFGKNAHTSYEDAAEMCLRKVEQIVKECQRVNQKYRDPHFDAEFDLKWGRRDCLEALRVPYRDATIFKPQSVKRVSDIFEKPAFYIDGPSPNDIRQGRDGDCWLMAALCIIGNKPGLIENLCVARDERVGVYGFVFYRDFEWRSEIIDDKLYLTKPDYDEVGMERVLWEDRERISSEEDYRKTYQMNSGSLYFAQCEDPNETWLPLLEKAYAKAHGDYAAIDGGFIGEGVEDLTGGVTTELFSTDILDKEDFWKNELLAVNDKFLFGCATGVFYGWGDRKGIKERHAYSIMKAIEVDDQRLLMLRNPWGKGEWCGPWSDGSKEWTPEWMQKLNHRFGDDGVFWISYEDLLLKFQTFDRTRLFDGEWNVAQQWTSLQVQWTIGYHETKFAFTIDSAASIVLVLSQLDGRYFQGFEGQYSFELSSRVHEGNELDYIVRSHGNYCMRRSVSAELELKAAGTYHVLMQIRAEKLTNALSVEQVLKDNYQKRRDKLHRIGLAYDLAHAKGVVLETPQQKQKKEKAEAKKSEKLRHEARTRLLEVKKAKKKAEHKRRKHERSKKTKAEAKATMKSAKRSSIDKAETVTLPPIGKEDTIAKVVRESAEESQTTEDRVDVGVLARSREGGDSSGTLGCMTPLVDLDDQGGRGRRASLLVPHKKLPSSQSLQDIRETTESCPDCSKTSASVPVQGIVQPAGGVSDTDISDVSSVTSEAVDQELKPAQVSDPVPATVPNSVPGIDKTEESPMAQDPWNAVVVVGLRVFAKGSKVSVKVVRPESWEDGEAALDVDDSAIDATIVESEDGGRRASVFRGRVGSIAT